LNLTHFIKAFNKNHQVENDFVMALTADGISFVKNDNQYMPSDILTLDCQELSI
jgi:hypothetical protein